MSVDPSWTATALLAAHLLPQTRRTGRCAVGGSQRPVLVGIASRPGSGVAHLYVGPATKSGRYVPARRRAVCGARTRRLTILHTQSGVVSPGGRRVCSNCSARLTPFVGRVEHVQGRDDWHDLFVDVAMVDLVNAVALAATVAETHLVGTLARILFGPPPARVTPTTPAEQAARYYLEQRILAARTRLRNAERTPEELAGLAATRADLRHNQQLTRRARRADVAQARAAQHQRAGSYLTPAERALVS